MNQLRVAFAGDRDIAVRVLDLLLEIGVRPVALLVSGSERATHADELTARCGFLPPAYVLRGASFRRPAGIAMLRALALDYIVGVHFPYVVSPEALALPNEGFLNLHPAYLPYNRGWHTPSWAILDETPIGATLHFMDEGIDTGDIVHQRTLEVSPADTAHTLYRRVKQLELEVFREAWPALASRSYKRIPQDPMAGSWHRRSDLLSERVQKIALGEPCTPDAMLRLLRALTTNTIEEAAYFEVGGKRYRVQLTITEESGTSAVAVTSAGSESGD